MILKYEIGLFNQVIGNIIFLIFGLFHIPFFLRAYIKRLWNEFFLICGSILILFSFYLTGNISYIYRILATIEIFYIDIFQIFHYIMLISGLTLYLYCSHKLPRHVRQRKKKWKDSSLYLKKISKDISSFENGYTPRPYSIKTSINFDDSKSFIEFSRSYVIFLERNYLINGRLFFQDFFYLFITNNFKKDFFGRIKNFCLFRGNITNQSWIKINKSGEIQILLSKKDYKEFTQPVSYHEVCSNLGSKFHQSIKLFLSNDLQRSLNSLYLIERDLLI